MWGHLEWESDRFRYTGSGWELYVGFIKAILCYGGIFILFLLAGIYFNEFLSNGEIIEGILIGLFGLLVFAVYSYALYSARRYLLSRTEWRGIRFLQKGKPSTFVKIRALHLFLTVITLGVYYPWYRHAQLKYVVDHTAFGLETFSYDGDASRLVRGFVKYYGSFLLAILLGGAVSYLLSSMVPFVTLLLIPLGVFLIAGGFFFLYFYYRAYEQRLVAAETRFQALRFEMDHSGCEYFRLKFFNGFLISLSGGLLTPVAWKRSAEFLQKHLTIHGTLDEPRVRADQAEGPRYDTGEELAEMFTRSVTLMGFFKI